MPVVLHEGVVLLGGPVGERLEPVRVVRDAFFQCPHTHAGGHVVGYLPVDGDAVVDGVGQGFIRFLGEIFLHGLPVEDVLAIIFGYFVLGSDGFHGLPVGSLLHGVEA